MNGREARSKEKLFGTGVGFTGGRRRTDAKRTVIDGPRYDGIDSIVFFLSSLSFSR